MTFLLSGVLFSLLADYFDTSLRFLQIKHHK